MKLEPIRKLTKEEAEKLLKQWRRKHPRIVAIWRWFGRLK